MKLGWLFKDSVGFQKIQKIFCFRINKHRCDERVFKSRVQRSKHQSSMTSSWSNDPISLCPCIQWKKSDFKVPGTSSYEDLVVLLWLKVAIEFDSIKKLKSNQEFQLEDETDPQK